MQRTLIIFKPDCVQRRLVGQILQRFEAKGLRVAALKLLQVDRQLGEQHYGEHKGKPFFEGLIDFITGGPVVVGVLEGNEAIAVVRTHARRHQRRGRRPGDDPRRLLDQQAEQPDPRLRQPRIRRSARSPSGSSPGRSSITPSPAPSGSSTGPEPDSPGTIAAIGLALGDMVYLCLPMIGQSSAAESIRQGVS